MKFYIASKLENAETVKRVADVLKAAGHIQTYDWTIHGSVKGEGEERLSSVAAAEHRGVLAADVLVVLLPGGRGTHAELGIALGQNGEKFGKKDVVICAETNEFFLQDDRTCAFYWMPEVTRVVGSLDEWLREIFLVAGALPQSKVCRP